MGLPDIKNIIKDGALGVLSGSPTGVFAAVGVCANYSGGIKTVTDLDQVKNAFGDGPLRDLLEGALSIAKTTVYALGIEGTVAGTIGTVTAGAENSGIGNVTAAGSPNNEYDIIVEILSDGGLNEATFRVTVDGAEGKRLTVPDTPGDYLIPGTGITLTFVPGMPTPPQVSFAQGDTWSFDTTAPSATNTEILAAVDTLLASNKEMEWIAVAGVTSSALWASLDAKAELAALEYKYLHFICQARSPNTGETVDAWAAALTGTERGSVSSTRLSVCAGWIEESDVESGQIDERGLIGKYCGMLAKRKEHEGPDAVKYGAVPGVIKLLPQGINDGHIENLMDAGYITAREIIGLNGIYVTSGQMMSDAGSDYDQVERRRVMDKACRNVRKAQLFWLNDVVKVGVEGSIEGLEMLKAQSEIPLKDMESEGQISSGEVIIPEGQNILATKKISTKVRIIPLGKVSYIENEIAYTNPNIGG